MESFIDYNPTVINHSTTTNTTTSSFEQMLNSPAPLDLTSEATQNFILNAHAYLHYQRHTVVFTNTNNNLKNERQDRNAKNRFQTSTRQDYYYPGLELSSPYEEIDNLDNYDFENGGLCSVELLDMGENEEFNLQAYLDCLKPDPVDANKPEYTAIPTDVVPLPISVQDEAAVAAAATAVATVEVQSMELDDSSDDDTSDDEDVCESDDDEDDTDSFDVAIRPPSPPSSLSPSPSSSSNNNKSPRTRAKKGEKRVHACPLCQREFTRACNLQSHILTHSNLKPHACSECDKTFARIYDMKRHKRIHSNSPEDKPYSCTECAMTFKRVEPRARHLQAVHGIVSN
ncbi:hypothetical protein BGX33_004476 [Mortierella sp. NVP41]|nr:hypothetical protein BGX33_004476 [Mortierella sp. NVP41]